MAAMNSRFYGRAAEASEDFLPARPPEWIPDAAAPSCQAATDAGTACGRVFDGFLEWRHHCRFCGRVVCARCSPDKMLLPAERWRGHVAAGFDFSEPHRVCRYCRATLEPFQERWAARLARSHGEGPTTDDGSLRYLNVPLPFYESGALAQEVQKAAFTLKNLTEGINHWSGDEAYVHRSLHGARALLFLTTARAAFIGGVAFGSGLVVARRGDGTWSPPCAVGVWGFVFGAVVGAEVTDAVTALGDVALASLVDESAAKVSLGAAASLALGPLGRTGEASTLVSENGRTATSASYSHSRGLYGGVTLEGASLSVRPDVNQAFYGVGHTAAALLRDVDIPQPRAAKELYAQLHAYIATNHAYVTRAAARDARNAAPGRPRASSLDDDADLSDHAPGAYAAVGAAAGDDRRYYAAAAEPPNRPRASYAAAAAESDALQAAAGTRAEPKEDDSNPFAEPADAAWPEEKDAVDI